MKQDFLEISLSQKAGEGALRERIMVVEKALSAYNELPTNVAEVRIHFALSIFHLIHNVNKDLKAYLEDLDKGECRDVIGWEWKKCIRKDRWQKCSRLADYMKFYSTSDLKDYGVEITIDGIKIKNTLDILQLIEKDISEYNDLLIEVKNRLKNPPRGLYKNFFKSLYGRFDAEKVVADYEEWEMKVGKMTFDILKTEHTTVVADFLKSRVLRYALPPTKYEMAQVDLPKVMQHLKEGYEIPDDFVSYCAILKRFVTWEGDVMVIDLDVIGKYLFQFYYDLSPNERRSFFELVTTLNLLHQSMAKLKPIVAEQLKLTEEPTLENTKYFAFANHMKKILFSEEIAPFIADKRFTNQFLGKLIDELMLSEYGDVIVERWRNKRKHDTLIGNIIGCFKSAGVLEGTDLRIAGGITAIAIGKNQKPKTLASYMGRCNDIPCKNWISNYVNSTK